VKAILAAVVGALRAPLRPRGQSYLPKTWCRQLAILRRAMPRRISFSLPQGGSKRFGQRRGEQDGTFT
jgi:hypothetical protein